MDTTLRNSGEVTNGNSAYESQVLDNLNRVHFTLICGGTIPLLKDTTVEIDEVWPWAKSRNPLILDLQPKYNTGTVTLTNASEAGVFSSAPSDSLKGWHIRIPGRSEWFRIASHTANATNFQLDDHYTDTTGSGLSFEAIKLDYELVPDHIAITTTSNNKIQFQETAGTTLTATLTSGTYTPAQLATQIQTQMNTTGGTPAYTVSYDSLTRKFTISSDRAGGAVFVLVGTGDQSQFSVHKTIGFDDVDSTNAAAVVSTYPLGCIARLVEPFRIHRSSEGLIYGTDPETFTRNYPFSSFSEGLPDRFCIVREAADGTITVRFNKYPRENTRVEVEHVPVPRDLKDSSASIPLLPRKWIDILEDAAVFYTMLAKSDDRVQIYANLVQSKLIAMISQHRGAQVRFGKNFGQMVPRPELTSAPRKGLLKNGGYTS